jgi:very-short-patch-repair endonuclease
MAKLLHNPNSLPYDPSHKESARDLRKTMTKAEKHLWYDFLSGYRPRFLRQRPIDHYIVDFYCPEKKLVIELDGGVHASNDARESDAARTLVLEGYGIQVIRFTNEDVMDTFDGVVDEIERVLDERSESPRSAQRSGAGGR